MSEQIISKRCSKCKEIKSISEFHKSKREYDGLQGWCKLCFKSYQQSPKGKEIQRKFRQSPAAKVIRKRYRQSEKGKVNRRINTRKHAISFPERIKAQYTVNNAIKVGRLPHADTLQCYYCPAKAQLYHHHLGYEKEHWLDVVPVCRKCHKLCHNLKEKRII